MLEPNAYRRFDAANGIDQRATIVGIRGTKKWEFWYQSFNHGGQDKHMISVTKLN